MAVMGRLRLFAINPHLVRLWLQSGYSSGMNFGGVNNRSRPKPDVFYSLLCSWNLDSPYDHGGDTASI